MKRTKLKRHSSNSISVLKRKADEAFSKFIRSRDTKCFTCDRPLPYEKRQAGHWISRAISATRYNIYNVAVQCFRCNINLYGNGAQFADRIIKEYGQEKFDELIKLSHSIHQFTKDELEELITKYSKI